MTIDDTTPEDRRQHADWSRRSVVQTGGVAGVVVAAGSLLGPADATPAPRAGSQLHVRTESDFDGKWRFLRGSPAGAHKTHFDDAHWRHLDLPHDFSVEDVPGGSTDGAATNDPSDSVPYTSVGANQVSPSAPSPIGPFDVARTPGGTFPPTSSGKEVGWTTNGEGWYRKHFTVDHVAASKRVEIQFDGAYCRTDVWLNGHHLGFVANGYVPFHFDLTPHLVRGKANVLAVRVRNIKATSRFYSGTGIFRHTRLVVTEAIRVPRWGVRVTTPSVTASRAEVAVKVVVENHTGAHQHVAVRAVVLDPQGRQVAAVTSPKPKEVRTLRVMHLQAELRTPALWEPTHPHLYRVVVQLLHRGRVVDEVTETFGVRSIRVGNDGLFLNDKPLKLRGGCIHHDHGPLGAVSLYRSGERRIELLLAAGFNAVRMSHNCPDPALLAACDRLGMLVYDEFSDMWSVGKNNNDYSKEFNGHWREDSARWVLNSLNHPSVIIRSIGNEIPTIAGGIPAPLPVGQRERAALGARIARHVRHIDSTRPICQGGGQGQVNPDTSEGGYVDVGDVHYMHDYTLLRQTYPRLPFVQSESFPATMYDDWKLATDNDYVIGDFTWTAHDYLGEAGVGATLEFPVGAEPVLDPADPVVGLLMAGGIAGYPWFMANVSDLNLIGQRRGQNFYRNVVWGRSELELLVDRPGRPGFESQAFAWSWYDELESWTWDGAAPLQPMRVHAYTGGDSVELFLNGTSVGSHTMTVTDKRVATFRVPYTPGTLVAVAYRGGRAIARRTLRTVGKPAALRLTPDRRHVTTSRDDLAYLLAEVVDAHGQLVPDAVVHVGFAVEHGQLLGVASGNPRNVDSFQRPRRWTYHGQAQAIVRPPAHATTMKVQAFAAGLTPASVHVPVRNRPYPG